MSQDQMLKKVKYGNTERFTFSKIEDTLDIPYLIELQKDSYKLFLEQGIGEVLADFSPIVDFSGRFKLYFDGYTLEGESKYDVQECKNRDATYALPLKVKARLERTDTGVVTESEVFMGDIPLMTENGSFIINGAERVIVSQLVRSPSVYCGSTLDKSGVMRYDATVIPNRGAWLEFKQDSNGILWVNVDKNRKISGTTLMRALGFGTDEELKELFGNDETIELTIAKDSARNSEDAMIELYKRLRPGEVPTMDGVKALINNTFFDARRYDLARVGRYKFNKKLSLARRITGFTLAEDVITEDGEVLATKGEKVSESKAWEIQNAGVNVVYLERNDTKSGEEKKRFKTIGNATVDLSAYVDVDPRELGILEHVYYPTLKKLLEASNGDAEALKSLVKENVEELVKKHITLEDIIATVNYNIGLCHGFGSVDNIDHLANRRVRSVGELMTNQFRLGITRLERVIRERMSNSSDDE